MQRTENNQALKIREMAIKDGSLSKAAKATAGIEPEQATKALKLKTKVNYLSFSHFSKLGWK